MSDEIPAETGDVFITFQNSTSWQSWHSSAHACTSSWLTNAERDAPVASVKVMVSASCLRGKRPSASSKHLRYLESQQTRHFPYPGFSKHDSESNTRVKSYTAPYHSYFSCGKNKTTHQEKNPILKTETTHQAKKNYASWKLGLFFISCIPFLFHVALTFVSNRLIWGSKLCPDEFDI